MEQIASTQDYRPVWLWALRISAIIALLPLLAAAMIVPFDWIPQAIPYLKGGRTLIGLALVLLLPVSVLLPYLIILWRVRNKPTTENGLSLAIIVGSWWYTFCSALTFTWFIDPPTLKANPSKGEVELIYMFVGIWLVVGVPHFVLLMSAMRTAGFPKYVRSAQIEPNIGSRWLQVARIAVIASMVFLLLPSLFLSPILKRTIPTSGLISMGLMVLASEVPYLFIISRPRAYPLEGLVTDLGTGLASGWIALFAMAALCCAFVLRHCHWDWTLPAFWAPFGITQTCLLVSSLRLRHLSQKTGGVGRPVFWNTLIPTVCFGLLLVVIVFYSASV